MFRKVIRIVFLFAYGAFLYASLRHIAFFFHGFEPTATDWVGSYALAISIDATALILTIGVMFFKKGMPLHAILGVWFFIFCLTMFSWVVNWEYAVQFQGNDLSRATAFQWVNPILASSFAFLNIAYSVIAELFTSEPKTVQDLQKELADLQQKSGLQLQLSALKNQQNSSWIKGKFQMFRDAISPENVSEIQSESEPKSEPNSGKLDPGIVANLPGMFIQNQAESESLSQLKLGMIEQAMYDALLKNPEEIEELQRQSQEMNLDDFTEALKQRYSQYAGYITPTRVAHVMQFVAQTSRQKLRENDPEIQESSSRKYFMTYEEAAAYTGYAISTLKLQAKRGEIEETETGKLRVKSLRIRSGNTGKIVAIKSVQKGA